MIILRSESDRIGLSVHLLFKKHGLIKTDTKVFLSWGSTLAGGDAALGTKLLGANN